MMNEEFIDGSLAFFGMAFMLVWLLGVGMNIWLAFKITTRRVALLWEERPPTWWERVQLGLRYSDNDQSLNIFFWATWVLMLLRIAT